MRWAVCAMILLFAAGCGCRPTAQHPPHEIGQSVEKGIEHVDTALNSGAEGKSFGIPNEFSGRLSDEQERLVPKALRGAFIVESLRTILETDLEKALRYKTLVAEESCEGKRYVALQDFRCVHFSDDVSGQMIVIERYVVEAK